VTHRKTPQALCTLAVLLLASCTEAPEAPGVSTRNTATAVRERGYVICGASTGTFGFSLPDEKGYWRGLDVDMCRAIAVAVLGDKDKARFVPLTGQQRLTALQSGEIDVLPRTTTWTLSRDSRGVNFAFPNFFDHVGFLVPRRLGASSVQALKSASICVQTGSTSELTLAKVSEANHLDLRPVIFDTVPATRAAFFSGRCDGLISDAHALESVRATQTKNAADYVVLRASDEVIPLAPVVRHGDDHWFDIVKWTFQALLMAEYLGITQSNVDAMLESRDPEVRRFLGVEPGTGRALGLDDHWAYQIVKQLGNYGEVFERNVGSGSPLKIERGMNRLQRDGGLMYLVPFS
jgi:general L-amino acid transport system substrate-binding protein